MLSTLEKVDKNPSYLFFFFFKPFSFGNVSYYTVVSAATWHSNQILELPDISKSLSLLFSQAVYSYSAAPISCISWGSIRLTAAGAGRPAVQSSPWRLWHPQQLTCIQPSSSVDFSEANLYSKFVPLRHSSRTEIFEIHKSEISKLRQVCHNMCSSVFIIFFPT